MFCMNNLFFEAVKWVTELGYQAVQFVILVALFVGTIYFIYRLFFGEEDELTEVNKERFSEWAETAKEGKPPDLRTLHKAGTKKHSTVKIGNVAGYTHAYLEDPTEDEKNKGLDDVHMFLVKPKGGGIIGRLKQAIFFWKTRLYMVPDALLVDDIIAGDVFVNSGGFTPILNWRVPSNLNVRRYVEAVKEQTLYKAYQESWDEYMNVAERSAKSEKDYQREKGLKESVMGSFKSTGSEDESESEG